MTKSSSDRQRVQLEFIRHKIPGETAQERGSRISLHALFDISDKGKASGVYVLEFDNGEQYVGESSNLGSRFAWHRRHQAGEIVAVSVARLPPDKKLLRQAERHEISRRETSKIPLRNKAMIGLPLGDSPFDTYVEPGVQADWFNGKPGPLDIGERGKLRLGPQEPTAKYQELVTHPAYPATLEAFALYVRTCIPCPHETEGKHWAVTALPSTKGSSLERRIAALSISTIETLVIGEIRSAKTSPWDAGGFINVAKDTKIPGIRRALKLEKKPGPYDSAPTASPIYFSQPDEVADILDHKSVADGARRLAIGQLRKGGCPHRRHHSYNLADDIFALLQQQEDEKRVSSAAAAKPRRR